MTYLQGDYGGAELLYRRAEEIFEKSLGHNHPHVATAISDRAGLLQKQVRAGRHFLNILVVPSGSCSS